MSKVENSALMLALSPEEIAKIANDEQRGLLFKQLPKSLKEGKIYIYCKKGRNPRFYLSKRQTADNPFTGKYNVGFNEPNDPLNGTVVGYINVGQFRPISWLAKERRWDITQQEFQSCSIICDNMHDYINETFPRRAVVYYLPIKNFRPFLTRCTLEDDIIRYDPTWTMMSQQYIHPTSAPGPWLHFNDELSAIPDIYRREVAYSNLPCTPEIPELNLEFKDTLSSRWNRFLLKLHKIFHKKRGE